MNIKDFFNLSLIRKKFSSSHRHMVKKFLNEEYVNPVIAARAIVLLSIFENSDDLANHGEAILNLQTAGREREYLVEGIAHALSDPLNAATIKDLRFNRSTSRIECTFITDQTILLARIQAILTPTWNAEAVVIWKQMDLINLASELEQESHSGELVTDLDEYLKNFNEN